MDLISLVPLDEVIVKRYQYLYENLRFKHIVFCYSFSFVLFLSHHFERSKYCMFTIQLIAAHLTNIFSLVSYTIFNARFEILESMLVHRR